MRFIKPRIRGDNANGGVLTRGSNSAARPIRLHDVEETFDDVEETLDEVELKKSSGRGLSRRLSGTASQFISRCPPVTPGVVLSGPSKFLKAVTSFCISPVDFIMVISSEGDELFLSHAKNKLLPAASMRIVAMFFID